LSGCPCRGCNSGDISAGSAAGNVKGEGLFLCREVQLFSKVHLNFNLVIGPRGIVGVCSVGRKRGDTGYKVALVPGKGYESRCAGSISRSVDLPCGNVVRAIGAQWYVGNGNGRRSPCGSVVCGGDIVQRIFNLAQICVVSRRTRTGNTHEHIVIIENSRRRGNLSAGRGWCSLIYRNCWYCGSGGVKTHSAKSSVCPSGHWVSRNIRYRSAAESCYLKIACGSVVAFLYFVFKGNPAAAYAHVVRRGCFCSGGVVAAVVAGTQCQVRSGCLGCVVN